MKVEIVKTIIEVFGMYATRINLGVILRLL